MVGNVFKTLLFMVIFVVVFDIGFYLYRVYTLNDKIETMLVTLSQEVSKNNYLPEGAYRMYETIMQGIAADMNGGDTFIEGFNINYDHDCNVDLSGVSGINFSKRLDTPADYGDIAVIELEVGINMSTWGFDRSLDGAANQVQRRIFYNVLTYTYQVPCLRYISVTE